MLKMVSVVSEQMASQKRSVMAAFQSIRDSLGDHFSNVFKTITTDNGSEFAKLSELEHDSHTKVYFAHPL